ncbi:hypothetical protein [Rubinisphaera sp.]|uniref:hypothetical protein n=1 Tax=Rubinisphaera sp. TaxID=2024857 RepID=UPI0025EE4BE1|nr:hypothetical protein [Rubinisphaera sp.]
MFSSTIRLMKSLACTLVVILTACNPSQIVAQEITDERTGIRVVLFSPADVEPPPAAVENIRKAMQYTEKFFEEEFSRWNYEVARKQIFAREETGEMLVMEIKGDEPATSEKYQSSALLKELWPKAVEKYTLPKMMPVWWVWVYLGDPPTRFSGYRGSGDLNRGGWALVNFENRGGELLLDKEMAFSYNEEFTLKGCIHEFGHGLGLPHLGPRVKDRAGNSLMGPRTVVFNKSGAAIEHRVYLSQASAAMLSRHFVFTGSTKDRNLIPPVAVNNFSAKFIRSSMEIMVTGQLESNYPAHSVIVIDEAEPKQVDYWRKAYVASLDESNKFRVVVNEPTGLSGTLRLLFCFENGAVTSDGKTYSTKSGWEKKYRFQGYQFKIED